MDTPRPSRVVELRANSETSVARAMGSMMAIASTTAMPAWTSGSAAATRVPKASSRTSKAMGMATVSARTRSCSLMLVMSA